MKLTSIELHPEGSSEVLVFSFRDPKSLNPYQIKTAGGLDSDVMTPKYYGADQVSKLYNLSIKKRVVVLQAGLNPDFNDLETYSRLRDDVYKTIAASRTGKVQLQFKYNTTVVAVLSGLISKVESDLFEQAQEVQITIECTEPMLKSPTPVQFDVDNLDPNNTPLNDGRSTAPHGLMFIMSFNAIVPLLTISNNALGFTFTIRPNDPFTIGDELHFSSDYKNKYLYRMRGTQKEHLADVVDFNGIWHLLFPGQNYLQVTPGDSVFWTEISHYETYWGV